MEAEKIKYKIKTPKRIIQFLVNVTCFQNTLGIYFSLTYIYPPHLGQVIIMQSE